MDVLSNEMKKRSRGKKQAQSPSELFTWQTQATYVARSKKKKKTVASN